MDIPQAYTTKEVCKIYNTSKNTVLKMAKEGRIKAGTSGRGYRFSPQECDRVFLGIEPDKKEKTG
jgi:excisionase family DNA binding protein